MRILRRIRFSMGTVMMLVVAAAAASALFAKVRGWMKASPDGWGVDFPAVLVIAIGLTAIAIAVSRKHTASQAALQTAVTCIMVLTLFWAAEITRPPWATRAVRYWFQAAFFLTVVVPLLVMRTGLGDLEPGPRRDWWRGNGEAVVASFANMLLVLIGGFIQFLGFESFSSIARNLGGP